MIYILVDEPLKESFTLRGELFKYLIKVRRHQKGDRVSFRYKEELDIICSYEIDSIENRTIKLIKVSTCRDIVKSDISLHVGWCIIDPKSIERVLPSLCEIGVEKISFINCDRTQKNYKLDIKRLERIVEASMQQSGRSHYMEFLTSKSIKEFMLSYPDTKVFDFCDRVFDDSKSVETILVGCEGGFSDDEKEFLKSYEIFRLNSPMVLKSESAVVAIASKVLL